VAELANLSPKERQAYNLNLKRIWDSYAALETSYHEGVKKGIQKGLQQGLIKGTIKGKIEGKIEALIFLLSQKFGSIPFEIENELRSVVSMDQIDTILSHIFEINDWERLKKYLSR
jgi:flagellar biosynthesis/type III secretory pathway protein FliH